MMIQDDCWTVESFCERFSKTCFCNVEELADFLGDNQTVIRHALSAYRRGGGKRPYLPLSTQLAVAVHNVFATYRDNPEAIEVLMRRWTLSVASFGIPLGYRGPFTRAAFIRTFPSYSTDLDHPVVAISALKHLEHLDYKAVFGRFKTDWAVLVALHRQWPIPREYILQFDSIPSVPIDPYSSLMTHIYLEASIKERILSVYDQVDRRLFLRALFPLVSADFKEFILGNFHQWTAYSSEMLRLLSALIIVCPQDAFPELVKIMQEPLLTPYVQYNSTHEEHTLVPAIRGYAHLANRNGLHVEAVYLLTPFLSAHGAKVRWNAASALAMLDVHGLAVRRRLVEDACKAFWETDNYKVMTCLFRLLSKLDIDCEARRAVIVAAEQMEPIELHAEAFRAALAELASNKR